MKIKKKKSLKPVIGRYCLMKNVNVSYVSFSGG